MEKKIRNTTNNVAVITGDIVNSRHIPSEEREQFINAMKDCFIDLNRTLLAESNAEFEIYRGDSIQAIVTQPELALLASIILRSRVRSIKSQKVQNKKQLQKNTI
ncbi:MAG: hypothetical protein IPO21_05175 [Bacteroidales bacterium]|nr:hypothetical protein [Bacteroidales bacterium]